MTNNELKIGDLIFYSNTLGAIEHIAMYIAEKDTVPYVVHAVSRPYDSIMLTQIKPVDPGCSYRVMRPLNHALTLVAAGILLRWVEHQVPFATQEKRSALVNFLDEIGGFDNASAGKVQEPHGKKTYRSTYLQYLDMANALPYIPQEEGEIKGLFCSEAIVSAFNIALLTSYASITSLLQGNEWSLSTFTSLGRYINALENPLPFDAKATLPAGIFEHCFSHPEQWSDQGKLSIENNVDICDHDKNKELWRDFKTALLAEAPEKLQEQLSSSPKKKHRFVSPVFFQTNTRSQDELSDYSSSMPSFSDLLTLTECDDGRERSTSSPFVFLDLFGISEKKSFSSLARASEQTSKSPYEPF